MDKCAYFLEHEFKEYCKKCQENMYNFFYVSGISYLVESIINR